MMLDNELMDVLSTPGKAGGGYCTSLGDYKVPFIFAHQDLPQNSQTLHSAGSPRKLR